MNLYNLFRVCLWLMYVCFFRRVYYLNAKRIPGKDPVIFISNHSNGFMDPILIAAMQPRPVYFWARASEFPDNFKGRLLYRLHGLPIHRVQDGKENMYKNEETFNKTRKLLHAGWNTAFIAPEGRCKVQKKLLPFKTGCARLAFKMMEENSWGTDVKIMPSGVNYTYHDKFRSEVYISLGLPLSVFSYRELYENDNEAAVQKLTKDMRVALRNQMIYVEEEDEDLVEKLLVLVRSNLKRGALPLYSSNRSVFEEEQKVANYVNDLGDDAKRNLEVQVNNYLSCLEEQKVADFAVANNNKRNLFWLVIGAPLWLTGNLMGQIPHKVARKLRNKFVPFKEFSASFAFTAALVVWLMWGIVWIVIASFFIGWWALSVPYVMAFLQTYAYHFKDYLNEWISLFQYRKVNNKAELSRLRSEIECLNL